MKKFVSVIFCALLSLFVLVGCGNTPYYFSKIFKKCTGFTPSAYVKKMYS